MKKRKNTDIIFAIVCVSFLTIMMGTIGVKFLTRQIIVKKLGINNIFTDMKKLTHRFFTIIILFQDADPTDSCRLQHIDIIIKTGKLIILQKHFMKRTTKKIEKFQMLRKLRQA